MTEFEDYSMQTLVALKKCLEKQEEDIKRQKDIINKRIEEITPKLYTCKLFNKSFTNKASYDKHITSKVYYEKLGYSRKKCRLCNRIFYKDEDMLEHTENGSCKKSRTCNGRVFSNMQSKSRYMIENKIKKYTSQPVQPVQAVKVKDLYVVLEK